MKYYGLVIEEEYETLVIWYESLQEAIKYWEEEERKSNKSKNSVVFRYDIEKKESITVSIPSVISNNAPERGATPAGKSYEVASCQA